MPKTEIKIGPMDTLVGFHLGRARWVFAPDFNNYRRWTVSILSIVSANAGINQTTLGKSIGIDTGNLVPLLDKLVNEGLLKREVDTKDRRNRRLSLTNAGKTELKNIMKVANKEETRRLAGFTKEERNTLISLLRRIHSQSS